jgi:hypothetical protein
MPPVLYIFKKLPMLFMHFRLYISLLLLPAVLFGQNREVDSLMDALTRSRDSPRVDYLNKLGSIYLLAEKRDSAIRFTTLAYKEAKKLNYTLGMAESLFSESLIAKHFDDDFRKSETFARESLSWYEKIPDNNNIWNVYNELWFACFAQSKYDEANKYGLILHQHSRIIRDTVGMIDALTGMNIVQYQKGNFDTAFYILQQAQQLAIAIGNLPIQTDLGFDFGTLYRAIGDYPIALGYYRHIFETDNPETIRHRVSNDYDIWARMEYAELFSLQDQFDSAWHYYHLVDTSRIEKTYIRVYLVSTGETYFLQKDYTRALHNFLRGLVDHIRLNDVNEIKRTLLDIGKTYFVLNDNKAALNYAQQGLTLSLQTQSIKYAADAYNILYSVYDRMHRTDSAYYYYLKYNSTRNAILSDQTKGKFAAYDYQQTIGNLTKEQLITRQQLSLEHQKLKSESLLRNILIGSILFVLLLGLILFRNMILRRKNEILQHESAQSELKQLGAELEMQALRAQMNPHFIFNCLNSINRFILKNETEPASDYLTKFSRLIRMVLINSKNKLITLEDELEMLRLYLDMERLRFKNHFEYKISFLNSVDLGSIYIPPLLLQPFVENAIWHGLMNKEDSGSLEISFSLEAEVLTCIITDNGVGREAATLFKSKSAVKEKSMGLKITRERLSLIQKESEDEASFEFVDLFDPEGNAAGTKVVLRIGTKEMYYK